MRLAFLSATALGAVVVLAASAQSPSPAPAPAAPAMAKTPLQVRLVAQNNSGETGTATLLDGAKGLVVRLRMANPTSDTQPVHIHTGTCDKLDPKPKYPLTTIKNGMSETTVPDVTIAQLEKTPYAINVHKSTTEVAVYVSCGNVVAAK